MADEKKNPLFGAFRSPAPSPEPPKAPADGKPPQDSQAKPGEDKKPAEPPKAPTDTKPPQDAPAKPGENKKPAEPPKAPTDTKPPQDTPPKPPADSKGEVARALAPLLIQQGYDVQIFDLIDPSRSDFYNPFSYLRDDKDAIKLINNLIKNTTPRVPVGCCCSCSLDAP